MRPGDHARTTISRASAQDIELWWLEAEIGQRRAGLASMIGSVLNRPGHRARELLLEAAGV